MPQAAIAEYNENVNTGQGYLLIVEDDPDILKLLDTTLTFRGYRVVTARNGQEGLEIIQKECPSVVIADIMMPKLDGFGLVHRLRINPETCEIPVVFITATYVTPEDREFALSIGATRFIQKPVDLEQFLKIVTELLQEGTHKLEPLKDFSFYEGYRQRLEVKLEQKNHQITRDEGLLEAAYSAEEKIALQASLRQTMVEREELKLLLDQIQEQIKKVTNAT